MFEIILINKEINIAIFVNCHLLIKIRHECFNRHIFIKNNLIQMNNPEIL